MCILHFCTNRHNYAILPISYLLQLYSLVQISFSVSIYIGSCYCRTLNGRTYRMGRWIMKTIICDVHLPFWLSSSCWVQFREHIFQHTLTRVGVWVSVCFGPLVRRGLLVEVVLRLHQRERVWEERDTAHGLMVPQPTVTAAFLRPVRQVKRDAPLRLQHQRAERQRHALMLVSVFLNQPATFSGLIINCKLNGYLFTFIEMNK